MKKLFFIPILFWVVSCSAYSIVYDSQENRIYSGAMDVSKEKSDPDRYVVQSINEFDPLLKNDLNFVTYDDKDKTFKKKTEEEIAVILESRRIEKLKLKARSKQQQINNALIDLQNGFEISVSTTQLKIDIDALLAEKESLDD